MLRGIDLWALTIRSSPNLIDTDQSCQLWSVTLAKKTTITDLTEIDAFFRRALPGRSTDDDKQLLANFRLHAYNNLFHWKTFDLPECFHRQFRLAHCRRLQTTPWWCQTWTSSFCSQSSSLCPQISRLPDIEWAVVRRLGRNSVPRAQESSGDEICTQKPFDEKMVSYVASQIVARTKQRGIMQTCS